MAMEPTFDQAGLGGPNSLRPGWYPDPDPGYRDGWERHWDGEGWRPLGERRPHTPAQVHLWYVLACMLPFTLSILLPVISLAAAPGTVSLQEWQGVMGKVFLAGFIPWLIGVAGTTRGFFKFEVRRFLRVGPARAWNFLAWMAAAVLFVAGTGAVLFGLVVIGALIGAFGGGIGL